SSATSTVTVPLPSSSTATSTRTSTWHAVSTSTRARSSATKDPTDRRAHHMFWTLPAERPPQLPPPLTPSPLRGVGSSGSELLGGAGLDELFDRWGLEAFDRAEGDDLLARLGVVLGVDDDRLA